MKHFAVLVDILKVNAVPVMVTNLHTAPLPSQSYVCRGWLSNSGVLVAFCFVLRTNESIFFSVRCFICDSSRSGSLGPVLSSSRFTVYFMHRLLLPERSHLKSWGKKVCREWRWRGVFYSLLWKKNTTCRSLNSKRPTGFLSGGWDSLIIHFICTFWHYLFKFNCPAVYWWFMLNT